MDQQNIVSHKSERMQFKTIRNIHQQILCVLKYSTRDVPSKHDGIAAECTANTTVLFKEKIPQFCLTKKKIDHAQSQYTRRKCCRNIIIF